MIVTNDDEMAIFKEGGNKLLGIRERLLAEIKVGAIPLQIDDLAKKLIKEAGGSPSFMTVKDYKWATCISVNDGVVHGIPNEVPFKENDLVSLDVGLLYKGFHTDTSWTKIVQTQSSKLITAKAGSRQSYKLNEGGKTQNDKERFVKVGEDALGKAIGQAKTGNRIGHISQAIQGVIEEAGYSVVKSLVGHGIGKKLHEPPQVPGILVGKISDTPELEEGLVIAIEVIYNQGKSEIKFKNDDGWTLVTADGSISGLFENTVAVTKKGPIVLT